MAKFKGFIKNCEVCGAEFKVPQSQAHVRTCSRECGLKIRRHPNRKDKVELKCKHCSQPFFTFPSHADRRVYCSRRCALDCETTKELRRALFSGERNPGWRGGIVRYHVSASGRLYGRTAPHLENEKSIRRKRARHRATPSWGNRQKVLEIYEQARKISELTGVQHHVDHIVPLTSKRVCGLHNEFNLRVIPAADNLRKHNRTWPDM